jgi:hypothetical protein
MSVLGIAGSGLFGYLRQNLSAGNNSTKFQQEFQQLGQELQSGNMTAAQSEFATLQQGVTQTSGATQSSSIAQAFSKLSQDLQGGNVTAAQSDYSALQQDMQTASAHGHHRHQHGGSGVNSASAQQVYSSLQQNLTGTGGVSVSA